MLRKGKGEESVRMGFGEAVGFPYINKLSARAHVTRYNEINVYI